MGRRPDLERIDAVIRWAEKQLGRKLVPEERFDFGDYIEECKQRGDRGSANDRGDFTWEELEGKAREYFDIPDSE